MRSVKYRSPKGHRHRRGATAVEFALVLPVMVTLLLGTVDFGRFAYTQIAVTNAARAGAAFGSMNPYSSATQTNWPGLPGSGGTPITLQRTVVLRAIR